MVLPALQVRVPNPANALLQAEQIKGVRAQAQERQQAAQQRNALLQATQGANLSTPGGQQQVVNALAGANPLAALQAQLQINQANAPATPTTAVRNFQFAQDNPRFAEFLQTSKSPVVNFESGALAPTTGTRTDLQKRELNAQGALQRLDDITASFDPAFLTFPAQLTAQWQSFKDKLGSVGSIFGIEGLTPEEKQSLTNYTTFTTRTLNNMNVTLNELSGAAVNEQEFERISGALPNAEDSPTEFQAKMTNAIRDMRRSVARFHHAQLNGLNPTDSGISLDGIDTLIDQTGIQLTQQLRAQGLPEEQIRPLVLEELRRMFGL